jgi:rhodanese-related sulfurtransferase
MRAIVSFTVTCLAIVLALPAVAYDVPKQKQTKLGLYLSPTDAAALVQAEPKSLLRLDVRTRAELQFVGVADGVDAHVPFLELSAPGDMKLTPNAAFVRDVEARVAEKGLGKTDKVLLICRSGDRSARAADVLAAAGFTNVYTEFEGFEGDLSKAGRRSVNGWKNAGLPWTYSLKPTQTYRPAP